LPERAFRARLEAVLEAPELASLLLHEAGALLSPSVAQSQASWVSDMWSKKMGGIPLTPEATGHVQLLQATMHLFLAPYERAITTLSAAAKVAPGVATAAAQSLMAAGGLPPDLVGEDVDGDARLVRAQILFSLGAFDTALMEVERALDVGLSDGTSYPEAHAH